MGKLLSCSTKRHFFLKTSKYTLLSGFMKSQILKKDSDFHFKKEFPEKNKILFHVLKDIKSVFEITKACYN